MPGGEKAAEAHNGRRLLMGLPLCVVGVAVNLVGALVAAQLPFTLYLDSLGTMLTAMLSGYIPGILVGYLTNFVLTATDATSIYYSLVNVLVAVIAAAAADRGWLRKPLGVVATILAMALASSVAAAVIEWFLGGSAGPAVLSGPAASVQQSTGLAGFPALLAGDFLVEIVDKALMVLCALAIVHLLPSGFGNRFNFSLWQQAPLTPDQKAKAKSSPSRSLSLRTKFVFILSAVMVVVVVVTTFISHGMYHRADIDVQSGVGYGVTNLVAEEVDADRIVYYLENGREAPGYAETEQALAEIRDSFEDVRYVYVYKILKDGCHVVFDPGAPGEPGSELGEVIPFDQAFMPYVDDLLAGRPIDPIVSDESYGWLLTVYQPLYDSNGECACYVAADISMDKLVQDEFTFVARIVILFVAFFIFICALVIWLAESGILLPINSISLATRNFAFDSELTRKDSVEQLRDLDIHTGDEVENLYLALTKLSGNTIDFIAEAQDKADTIERMQENLIMVMADMVESRDRYTGDHVRKTAEYVEVTLKQMREEGIYADELTDTFISDVVKSAPLHDIGKIEVSDTILNKPGRLTDEEFKIMQSHTIAGEKILESATSAMSDPGYLDEACRLAAYHHEKWNGKGYPYGLAGTDIPLSARVMAVADVFDALVSKRSYKDGMPIEKALQIIHDDAGVHFDPLVAQAFLHAEADVRRIAEQHGDSAGTASDIRA